MGQKFTNYRVVVTATHAEPFTCPACGQTAAATSKVEYEHREQFGGWHSEEQKKQTFEAVTQRALGLGQKVAKKYIDLSKCPKCQQPNQATLTPHRNQAYIFAGVWIAIGVVAILVSIVRPSLGGKISRRDWSDIAQFVCYGVFVLSGLIAGFRVRRFMKEVSDAPKHVQFQ